MRERLGYYSAKRPPKKNGPVIAKSMSRAQFDRSRKWVLKKYAEAWFKLGER